MSSMAHEAAAVYRDADCLYTSAQVEAAIARVAEELTEATAGKEPLVLAVMTGGLVFAGRLLPQLEYILELDYIHATRYREATSGGHLEWRVEPHASLAGRVVVVVDDILDEGHTLAAILEHCRSEQASEVYSAVLVDKHHERRFQGLRADFVGVDVDDRYVFGYGMDYKGYLRNAPGIFAVRGR